MRSSVLFLVGAAAAAMLAAAPAHADKRVPHDELRRAVESGEARPLADIIAAARDKLPGEIVGVKVEREESRWMYEFRVIDRDGRLLEVHVDASSGAIERIKEK